MTDANVLGFIGLGVMGESMCRNLAKKSGARVVAYDARSQPLDALAADGVERAACIADVATRAGTIFLCLPGEPPVRAVCLERDGLAAQVRAGQTVVDMSAVPVALARGLGGSVRREGRRLRRCAGGAHGAGGARRNALDHGGRRARRRRAAPSVPGLHGDRDHALRLCLRLQRRTSVR